MTHSTELSAALSSVINRAEDCGLREIARTVQAASHPVRQHYALVAALRAAEVLQASALHFGLRPVEACARELEIAAHRALGALNVLTTSIHERAASDGVRERGDFTMEEWLANGGRPPPLLTHEQWEAGDRLPVKP